VRIAYAATGSGVFSPVAGGKDFVEDIILI